VVYVQQLLGQHYIVTIDSVALWLSVYRDVTKFEFEFDDVRILATSGNSIFVE